MEQIDNIMKKSQYNNYIGENITQLEHAILAAMYAEEEFPYDMELIVGAFLHDIGHQLIGVNMISSDGKILGVKNHETRGAIFLKGLGFSEKICNVVANHVRAKKYLAYIDSYYIFKLSDASYKTFILQGGMMTETDANEFTKEKYFNESIHVRKYDEMAKDITKLKKPLWELYDNYISMVKKVLLG
jgi:putative nucleotidyltransferase with HDIG domain